MKFIFTFFMLSLYWILLSGHFDSLHLALGFFSCFLVTFLMSPVFFRTGNPGFGGVRFLLRFIAYTPRFTLEIVLANIDLAYRTLHPRMAISPRMIKVRTGLKTDFGKMVLGNAITLQPGTITVGVSGDEFLVHAIAEEPARTLMRGALVRSIRRMEWL